MRRLRQSIFGLLLALVASVAPATAQILGPSGEFDTVTTPVAVTNSTAATVLYSVTVPAGVSAAPRLTCDMIGRIQTDTNARAGTLTMAYGGQTLTLISTATVTATTSARFFNWQFRIGRTAAARADLNGTAIIGTGSPAVAQVFNEGTEGVSTLATSANRTLTVTWTWGASGSSVTLDNVICRVG